MARQLLKAAEESAGGQRLLSRRQGVQGAQREKVNVSTLIKRFLKDYQSLERGELINKCRERGISEEEVVKVLERLQTLSVVIETDGVLRLV